MTQFKNIYEQYNYILRQLSINKRDSIEESTRSRINFYRNTSEDYVKNITKYIYTTNHLEQGKTSLTNKELDQEESNYSSRLHEKLTSVIPLYQNLKNDLKMPFKLFVMGPGNYGKSTLINSILGTKEKHAIENVQPMTWKIDVFEKNSNSNQVVIVYKNGLRKPCSKIDAQQIIDKEESKTKESKLLVKNKMIEYLVKNNLSPKEKKELKLKMERDEMYYSDIVEVHWGISNSPFLNQFSIVDTPGLNQENFSGEVRNNVQEYYHKSDGVIWLLDATTISAKNTDKLLTDLDESLQEMGGKRATGNMIAVLNRIDLVSKIPGQREQVLEDAERIYGNRFKRIVPYSALDVYKGIVSEDEELMDQSGRNDLLNEIKNTFFQDAKAIQCEKKNEACSIYNGEVKNSIEKYQEQLEKDSTKLSEALRIANETLIEEKTRLVKEYNRKLHNYIDSFARDLTYKLEHLNTLTDEVQKKNYTSEVIFNHPALLNELKEFMDKAHISISNRTQEIIRENQFTQYKNLKRFYTVEITLPTLSKAKVKTDISVSMPSIGKIAAYSAGVGLLFGPIGVVIGGGVGAFFSNAVRKNTMDSFMDEAVRIKEELWAESELFLKKLKQTAETEVKEHLRKSFCGMYNIESQDLTEVIDYSNLLLTSGEKVLQEFDRKDLTFESTVTRMLLS